MMTTVSTRKSAKPNAPPPPTILTLTLNADGTGTLLTKRGDLACANKFVYRDLKEIIAAIQHGAAQLVEIEQNLPPDAPSVPSSSDIQPATPIEAPSSTEVNGITDENGAMETPTLDARENEAGSDADNASESATTTLLAEVDDLPTSVNGSLDGVTRPANSVQMPLL
jgi:hypothetical protein